MRSNPADFQLTAPPTLGDVLALLAAGTHTPLSGGTELMVALGAGRLPRTPLVSLQHLDELRFIETNPRSIVIGSRSTFTDLRTHPAVASSLPLLAHAASWTGSIANQNRGTLGGNVVNASPAADSPPALLAYEATLTLISASGTRTLPYLDFHRGYKQTALRPDELLHSITVPTASGEFPFTQFRSYARKVGTRNAQAVSKVALACLARVENERLVDVRIGAASLRDRPIRCTAAEQALSGQAMTPDTLRQARAALIAEVQPIDDIRSTAKYRAAVAANLLEEFLTRMG